MFFSLTFVCGASDQPIHQNKDWDSEPMDTVASFIKSDQPIHQNKDWDIFVQGGHLLLDIQSDQPIHQNKDWDGMNE